LILLTGVSSLRFEDVMFRQLSINWRFCRR